MRLACPCIAVRDLCGPNAEIREWAEVVASSGVSAEFVEVAGPIFGVWREVWRLDHRLYLVGRKGEVTA